MLEINASLFVQIANFLLLLFILNMVLYRPIRNMLRKRGEETSSLQKMIEEYRERANEEAKNMEESLLQTRKEGYREKEDFRGKGLEEEKGILKEANALAEEKIESAKEEIETKIAEVRGALEDELMVFSSQLAEKILGRSI